MQCKTYTHDIDLSGGKNHISFSSNMSYSFLIYNYTPNWTSLMKYVS